MTNFSDYTNAQGYATAAIAAGIAAILLYLFVIFHRRRSSLQSKQHWHTLPGRGEWRAIKVFPNGYSEWAWHIEQVDLNSTTKERRFVQSSFSTKIELTAPMGGEPWF